MHVPLSSPKGPWHLCYTHKELGLDAGKGNREVWRDVEKLRYSLSWTVNALTLKSAKSGEGRYSFALCLRGYPGGGEQTGELSRHEHAASDPAVREYAHAGANKAKLRLHKLPFSPKQGPDANI